MTVTDHNTNACTPNLNTDVKVAQEGDNPARKNPSKRLRFDVFKRDSFTCQYCGAQPPDAVLVCDHIDPVARGGKTTIDNLITACEPCNQGKAAKVLRDRLIRPDADLMYLEVQQEVSELKRFQAAEKARDEMLRILAEDFQDRWNDTTGDDYPPEKHIFVQMLRRYSPEVVQEAVLVTSKKEADGHFDRDFSQAIPYLWGVAKRISSRIESEGISND